MPKTKLIMYKHSELAEILVRERGIKSGLWGLSITFGFGATNVQRGEGEGTLNPAAIVPVLEIGIRQFDKPNSLTFDASTLKKPAKPKKKAAAKRKPKAKAPAKRKRRAKSK